MPVATVTLTEHVVCDTSDNPPTNHGTTLSYWVIYGGEVSELIAVMWNLGPQGAR